MLKNSYIFTYVTIFGSVALLAAGLSLAQSSYGKEMEYNPSDYTSKLEPPSLFLDFNQKYQLHDLLKNATSVENFLSGLPPMLRQSYTLIYKSGSIQEATPLNPRVLLFSPTADLVLSFNGHADMVGGEAIEAIEYDDISNRYVFHEVTFDAQGHSIDVANPRKCQACHTEAYIPNWRAYEDWRGAYGDKEDRFDYVAYDVFKDGHPGQALKRGPEELANFKLFSAGLENNGDRYRYLLNPYGNSLWPYSSSDYKIKGPSERNDLDFQPNRRLTLGLVYHLSRMLGSQLKSSSIFHDYPANLISQFLECNGRDDSFVKIMRQTYMSDPLLNAPIFDISTPAALQDDVRLKGSSELYPFLNMLVIAGISPQYWSINTEVRGPLLLQNNLLIGMNGGLTSYTGFEDINEAPMLVGLFLYGQLAKSVPDLEIPQDSFDGPTSQLADIPPDMLAAFSKLIPIYGIESQRNKLCPRLAPLAKLELERNTSIGVNIDSRLRAKYERWKNGYPYAIDRCIICHAQGAYSAAPYIPFDKPELLKVRLQANHGALLQDILQRTQFDAPDEIRMPRGPLPLLPDQRDQLIRYLRQL